MAITVQARQANGEWHVRNAFIDDNKLVIAGSMKKDDLLRKAQKACEQWRAYDDGKQLRVHDSEADVKSAPRKTKFQGFNIEQTAEGFSWAEGGYFSTLAECQDDIARFNSDLRSAENIYGLASIQQSIEQDRSAA